jgi:hypothetical protein
VTTAAPTATKKPVPAARAPLPPGAVRIDEVLIIAGSALVLITGAFVFLARLYYKKKLLGDLIDVDPATERAAIELAWTLVKDTYFWSFATFSLVGTAAVTTAVLWPREVGHGLAALYGVAFLIAGGKLLVASPMPPLVGILLVGLGGLMLALTWASYTKLDRAAWAFLFSLSGALTIIMFFGTPRIRATLTDEPPPPELFNVLVLPAVMAAIAVACFRMRRTYLPQGTPTTL